MERTHFVYTIWTNYFPLSAKFNLVTEKDINVNMSKYSKGFTWLLSLGILGVSGAVGWVLMKTISPSREEMLKAYLCIDYFSKRLPESDPAIMRESRRRSQEWLDAIKAAAENPNPIHMSFDPNTPKKD